VIDWLALVRVVLIGWAALNVLILAFMALPLFLDLFKADQPLGRVRR
jgi:hypothetical protein